MNDHMAPCGRGQRGRLEVWYTTMTHPATGTGVWLHHEHVVPVSGSGYTHGWAAVFPPGGPPVHGRFGPTAPDGVFGFGDATVTSDRLAGRAGDVSWELEVFSGGEPLFTFPRWAWRHHLLPAAQMVPAPSSRFDGVVRWGDQELVMSARGATGRIYGHGNARRWAWVHADLGGDDVLEVVAAVSTRPVLRALPPLTFLRLRVGGREWPGLDPLLATAFFKADVGYPKWTVAGRVGTTRIRVDVSMPPGNTLELLYRNPDNSTVTCRNSERATCTVILDRGGVESRWHLEDTAHAEVGG